MILTIGGLFTGLVILIQQFAPWAWKLAAVHLKVKKAAPAGKGGPPAATGTPKIDIREHVPFLVGMVIGVLAISSEGGAVKWLAAKMLGASNWAGDGIMSTGVDGQPLSVTRTAPVALTASGGLVLMLLIAVLVVLRKAVPKGIRNQLAAGIWCGATLGLSAGLAGVAGSVIIPPANQFGAWITGAAL